MENIPAQVCVRCGKEIFSREATEKVRLIVRGKKKPIKSVQMDVLLMPENEIPDMKINIGNFYSPKGLAGFHESTINPRPCPCNHPNGFVPR